MDLVFKALADETRRLMLDRLFIQPGLTLTELIDNTDMRRQSASKHVQILEAANLVHVEWVGREKKHFLNPIPIREISKRWVDKFSGSHVDALVEMKATLEQSTKAVDAKTENIEQGPEVTSFFTPIKD